MADEKDTIILEFKVDTKDAVVSIENLTKANKELREERKKVDTSTEDGQVRIKQINQQLDNNTAIIKNNSSALEKQRLNVGNYSGALDKLIPGLGATANGFATMTKEALIFIANPIGAIIAALGLAVAALTAYFKGSEEGQDRLAKITAVLGVAFDKLMVAVENIGEIIFNIGEALYDLATGQESVIDKMGVFGTAIKILLLPLRILWEEAKALADLFTFVFPGASKAISDAVKGMAKDVSDTVKAVIEQGKKVAALQDEIDSKENEMIVRRAETNKKVAQLREQALSQEGDDKRRTIQQAIDLEKGLADFEVEQAKRRLVVQQEENKSKGRLTEEQKKQIAELTAAVINAEAERSNATLKFTKQLEALKDQQDKAIQKQIEEDQKIHDKNVENIQNEVKARQDANAQIEQDAQEVQDFFNDQAQQQTDNEIKQSNFRYENYKREQEGKKKLKQQEKDDDDKRLGEILLVNQKVAQFNAIAFENNKDIAAATAGVSMWVAATKDLEKGWPLGAILAALDIATGLANIAHIEGIQFAQGGYTGQGNPTDPAGTVHKNEFVMPSNVVNRFGADHFQSYLDGSVIANAATNSGGSQQPVQVNLGLKEFNEFSTKMNLKESFTSA